MIKIVNQTQDLHDKNLTENLEEIRMTVKEAANYVNESPGVVRNWMRELKAHIPTVQGDNGYHYFDKPALERLLLIRKLNREQNYSLKQIEYYFVTGEPVKPEPINEDSSRLIRKDLAVIMERLERQEQFNQALVTKLDEQQQFNRELGSKLDKQEQYIKDSLKKRDQLLLESLKNTQEAKKAELKKKWYKWW